MPQAITTRGPILAVTESPTIEQLQVWWEIMQSDDLSVAYADSFPATLTDVRREVARGERLLLLGTVDGQAAAALVLGLAMPRRYVIRRLFNAAVAPGTRQSRWQSWLEVLTDTAVALVLAIVLQRLCYGAAATVTKAGGVTLALYVITLGRRYALRRVFEAWHARQAGLPPYGQPLSSELS